MNKIAVSGIGPLIENELFISYSNNTVGDTQQFTLSLIKTKIRKEDSRYENIDIVLQEYCND